MAQYHALGISVFVLSAHPNLEEASRVGAAGLPRFVDLTAARRGAVASGFWHRGVDGFMAVIGQ